MSLKDALEIALSVGLAEYLSGPPRFSLRGHTRSEKRRLITDAQGLVSLEDGLEITLIVEEDDVFEETNIVDQGVYRDAHGKHSRLAANPNSTCLGNTAPFPEVA